MNKQTTEITTQLRAHLDRGGAFRFVQSFGKDGGGHSHWQPTTTPFAVPSRLGGLAQVYWGVHPTTVTVTDADRKRGWAVGKSDKQIAPHVASKNDTVAAINAFYADFDGKDEAQPTDAMIAEQYAIERAKKAAQLAGGTITSMPAESSLQFVALARAKESLFLADMAGYKALALNRVYASPLAPSVIVDSGGGYQAYWLLDAPFIIDGIDARERAKWLQAAWVETVGADMGVKDLRRILRVPGLLNIKSAYGPDFPMVDYAYVDLERVYTIGDLASHIPAKVAPQAAQRKTGPLATRTNGTGPSVIDAFNANYTITDILERQGYTWAGDRMVKPGGKNPSVAIYEDDNQSYHHGGEDPLHDGHRHDAFSVYAYFEHGGDNAKAVREAAKALGMAYAPAAPTRGHSKSHSTPRPADDHSAAPSIAQPYRLPPPPDGDDEQPEPFNPLRFRAEDGGIMDAWLELYGQDWIFVVGSDVWHRWQGTHWAADVDLSLENQLINLLDEMNTYCARTMRDAPGRVKAIGEKYAKAGIEIPDSAYKEIERIKTDAEIAKKLHSATKRSNGRISSIEGMCQAKRAVATDRINTGDALNLANGVLSLKSLELRPHERVDLFTYCLPYDYDPAATCSRWEQFVGEVLVKEQLDENGQWVTDPELVLLFQELVGYSLTPYTKYDAMVWMFGEGSNGKSVAVGVVENLLGEMAVPIDFQTLGQPGNYDMADIPGKRVIFSTESERGRSTAENLMKKIVTGDSITARPIYGSPIKFKSVAKIWWSMNDKPVVKDTTDGMWRRMKLIPFLRKFEEGKSADPDLAAKLAAELSGILNWAIAGLVRLTVTGKFTKAESSDEAKREYREEANPVAQWVATMCVPTAHPATLQAALFENFVWWCDKQKERTCTATQFGKDLRRLNIQDARRASGRAYALALVDSALNERN